MKVIIILVCAILALILLGWLGLQIKPAPFPAFPQQPPRLETVPLPDGLPAPVERFYRQIYGENVPVIESAVITGRARVRVRDIGITFPGRFRIIHNAGQGYRHYIKGTFFGSPLINIDDSYSEFGKGRMKLPLGVTEGVSKIIHGVYLAIWAESVVWLPSILITDPRVRWEPVDENTALLVVPFGEKEERFVVRFAPETGLPHFLEAMRYRAPTDEAKILWLEEAREWNNTLNGNPVSTVATITWFDEGTPWAIFNLEEVIYNVDVKDYMRAKGPIY